MVAWVCAALYVVDVVLGFQGRGNRVVVWKLLCWLVGGSG